MIPQHHIDQLNEAHACQTGIDWLLAEDRTWETWWRDCLRGDHILWFAAFVGVDEELVASTKAQMNSKHANSVRARIPWEIVEAAIAAKWDDEFVRG